MERTMRGRLQKVRLMNGEINGPRERETGRLVLPEGYEEFLKVEQAEKAAARKEKMIEQRDKLKGRK